MRRFSMIAVVGLGAMSLSLGTTGVASAATDGGCTTVQQSTGIVCVTVRATSPQSIESFGGSFKVGTRVVRPRLVAELLKYDGSVGDRIDQEWDNDRIAETITKQVDSSFDTRFSRVCVTLYEAGEKLNTACTPVPSQP